jgi:16S rRNA (cytidine1402-2'-O)-methyltransferase
LARARGKPVRSNTLWFLIADLNLNLNLNLSLNLNHMPKGKLFLIPTTLSEGTVDKLFSESWKDSIRHIQFFCVENVRSARRFLSSLKIYPSIEALNFSVLDKTTQYESMTELLRPLQEGHDIGIISESGIPAVADPGHLAVAFAHAHDLQVRVLPGPSSIMMALAASGFNGQQFAFHGYLPIGDKECAAAIKLLEKESRAKNQTQIFIETPFRNNRLLKAFLKNLSHSTHLCVALDVTGDEERIISKPVFSWAPIELPKLPAVFLFQSA